MSTYLKQGDPSHTCCDCTSRTGPCDNCGDTGGCDQARITKTKCGFQACATATGNDFEFRFYLAQTERHVWSCGPNQLGSGSNCESNGDTSQVRSFFPQSTLLGGDGGCINHYRGSVAALTFCSGHAHSEGVPGVGDPPDYVCDCDNELPPDNFPDDDFPGPFCSCGIPIPDSEDIQPCLSIEACCNGGELYSDCRGDGFVGYQLSCCPTTNPNTSDPCLVDGVCNCECQEEVFFTVSPDDEYTTELLIEYATAELPIGPTGYDGFFGGGFDGCNSYRNLSADETSITLSRFKLKLFFGSGNAGKTVYWTETFTPYPSGSPTKTHKSAVLPGDGKFLQEILEPATNGTIAITYGPDLKPWPAGQ